jgi:hypothetical protein
MIQSIEQAARNNKILSYAFRATNNIPLDTRFIVNSLTTLDTEIPLDKRYEGLIFFVLTATVDDGTSITQTGVLYCFEKDLTKPVPIHELGLRYVIKSVGGFNGNYSTIFDKLNHTYSDKIGSIIYVEDLDICVIKISEDIDGWVYLAGIYKVLNNTVYETIPLKLRAIGRLVELNGDDRFIQNNAGKTLSNPVMVFARKEDIPLLQNYRYYLINGFLNYCIEGTLYQVTEKFINILNKTLVEGSNIIIHNFNSTYIIAYLRIYKNEASNVEFDDTIWHPIEYKVIDNNSIDIKSRLSINKCDINLLCKN